MKKKTGIRRKNRRISDADIDAVTRFLPILRSIPANKVGLLPAISKAEDGTVVLRLDVPYHPKVKALMRALNKRGFVRPFNWSAWHGRAARLYANPTLLRKASLETCIKLITTHVRKDRFCGGHFGAMVRCGYMSAILGRLADIGRVRRDAQ